MTMSYSEGFCKNFNSRQEVVIAKSAVIALVDGGANADTIFSSNTSTTNFLTLGFNAGDKIYVRNATNAADDISGTACTAVVAATITLPTGTWTAGQAEGVATTTIIASKGGSFKDLMNDGDLYLFKGTQPTAGSGGADAAASAGDILCTISHVLFADAVWNGTDKKAYVELSAALSGTGSLAGTNTVSWFRFCARGTSPTDVSNGSQIRLDGGVGASSDLVAVNTSITLAAPVSITSFKFQIPQAP